MNVYWYGYHGNSYLAENLRLLIESLQMTLTCIHEKSDPIYNRLTINDELKKADVIILPCNPIQDCKSNNKLTQSLVLGKPVICSPLDAYLRIKKKYQEEQIFIAYNEDDWKKYLTQIKCIINGQ